MNEGYVLIHHGVKGQKWGVRRNQINSGLSKAKKSLNSAKELKDKAGVKKAKATIRQYKKESKQFNKDAKKEVRSRQKDFSANRSMGHKIAVNILAGPFANKTYNAMRMNGKSRAVSLGTTILANYLGGPIGHAIATSITRSDYRENTLYATKRG